MERKQLRVLFVEDSEDDLLLLLRQIRLGGYDPLFVRIDTADDLREALRTQTWDVVVSDWRMPHFDAPAALAVVKDLALDLPFIIVSGDIDDRSAVEAMRAGAHDFMAKQNLARLLPVIEREIREAGIRREQRQMQERLLISDRMVSLGTLAAGVAHEINNPLASVMANLDLAARELGELAERLQLGPELVDIRDELRDAREAAVRIRNIVRDMKIFSHSGHDEATHGAVEINRVLESTLRMAWNEIRHRAVLDTEFGEVPPVLGSESRIGQVMLNLVVNAAQSIREGQAEHNRIRVRSAVLDANMALVEVTDTGSGMSAKTLEQLFTPFFTTKPVGVGTGLGLSICHRIVSELGGHIEVSSRIGEGSQFRVYLPIASGGQTEQFPAFAATAPTQFRRGRVLAVDDEPMIVRAIERILADEHEVHALTSADEALRRIEAGARYDVILCDLMMPQMTGMDLHAELTQRVPEQAARMIFLTGGAFTVRAREFLGACGNPNLEKPFDGAQLRALVNGQMS